MQQHNFNRKIKSLTYWYCGRCGLILLNNLVTRKLSNKACNARWEKED